MAKRCWIISDGSAGMINQAWGLAETLGYEVEVKKISLRQPWESLSPYLRLGLSFCLRADSDPLLPPYPDLILASGRRAVLPALYLKHLAAGHSKVVYVQDPRINPTHFDAVVCPAHDRLSGPNVIQTIGATHRITTEKLQEARAKFHPLNPNNQPVLSVIIGGSTKKFEMDASLADQLIPDLVRLDQQGWRILVTLSRRTPSTIVRRFKEVPASIYVWDGRGENPYFGLLGLADAILVTCDSVSMISEACATKAPVYLYKLSQVSKKHTRFHQSLLQIQRVQWWDGKPKADPVTPLRVNEKAAAELRSLLKL
ncbi:mitochondrial fission ELM1 family protein [Candidatus Odyssella thessalonicensis]|uniref:mitochondrial fission ELM1 family protein n=1 Tax=Candidatus Odyssella thessalonicensis TaxID=84647 RepID=UPI000225A92B|nr:mitochondrial fission ELM1 family protein [Candidatus Odyssella thessalonicensis]